MPRAPCTPAPVAKPGCECIRCGSPVDGPSGDPVGIDEEQCVEVVPCPLDEAVPRRDLAENERSYPVLERAWDGSQRHGGLVQWAVVSRETDAVNFDLVGAVRSYRVAADATVVALANESGWHQLCTEVQGLLTLTPGADDPSPRQLRNDGLYPWSSHLAAIKTDRAGTIARIEQLYRP